MENIIITFSQNIIILLKCMASEMFVKCFLMIFMNIITTFYKCYNIFFGFLIISYEYPHDVHEMNKISYKYHMNVFFFRMTLIQWKYCNNIIKMFFYDILMISLSCPHDILMTYPQLSSLTLLPSLRSPYSVICILV